MTTQTINTTLAASQQVHHLYQRAGFGISPQEWLKMAHWTKTEALHHLFNTANKSSLLKVPASPLAAVLSNKNKLQKEDRNKLQQEEKKLLVQQNAAWLRRMANPQNDALLERMSLFWHGHFACESKIARLAIQQLNSIRQHALGSFRDLVLAIAKDPAMIRYLNNQQNRKDQPNENFARELMELFTLGRGNYTEQDIKEAARAFTGWSSNKNGEYVFRARQHDYGVKTFMGKTGNFNGEEIIDIILEKQQTALFITKKIYRYFVNEQVDEMRVAKLADLFYQSNYNIYSLMWEIFNSDWFYAPSNMGNKIKSPTAFLAGMIRHLNITDIDDRSLIGLQRALGQILFKPPNVAGWPGGKTWVDNSTLMIRLQLAAVVYKASEVGFRFKDEPEQSGLRKLKKLDATINWQPIYRLAEGINEEELYSILSDYLLPNSYKTGQNTLMPFVAHTNREESIQTLCIRLISLPEYQLC
ncbi:MAG: DUF1800 domain-containing protein [Chitinophagales bacterium]|nr:DUF1800 domain-containing protein [Chitinophagales bacterium]